MSPFLVPEFVLRLAGLGQLALALGSLAIPALLRWPEDVARLRPLTRQVFWVYALYIWTSHLAFASVSILAPAALTDRSLLAACVTSFIGLWWATRMAIQFTCLDRRSAPQGWQFRVAEAGLVTLFVGFTVVYGLAALSNLL